MSAICGKRSFFEDLHTPPLSPSSKRLRCSGSSPRRLSLPPCHAPTPCPSVYPSPINHLIKIFPDMDQQLLKQALDACGNDLDYAIKSLNELRSSTSDVKPDSGMESNYPQPKQGGDSATEISAVQNNLPTNGSEFVELFVSEMMNASDIDDAKARASRVLQMLEKSISSRINVEVAEGYQKENTMLKEKIDTLFQQNNFLKRAVAIQNERQKEHDVRSQEVQQLKQLVSQYKEQVRTLEVNNYALAMDLRQSQQSTSIPGRFHPDVF